MGKNWDWKLSIGIIVVGIITSVPVLALGSVGALPALVVNIGSCITSAGLQSRASSRLSSSFFG
jgi:ABC-type enterochelin transport system permease subunit